MLVNLMTECELGSSIVPTQHAALVSAVDALRRSAAADATMLSCVDVLTDTTRVAHLTTEFYDSLPIGIRADFQVSIDMMREVLGKIASNAVADSVASRQMSRSGPDSKNSSGTACLEPVI